MPRSPFKHVLLRVELGIDFVSEYLKVERHFSVDKHLMLIDLKAHGPELHRMGSLLPPRWRWTPFPRGPSWQRGGSRSRPFRPWGIVIWGLDMLRGCHLVKFSLVRHQRWKLTVTGSDVNWSITWGERCNQAVQYFLKRTANERGISWKYLVHIMDFTSLEALLGSINYNGWWKIHIIGGASKLNLHHWKRFQAACFPPTLLPAQGAQPVPGSCT